MSLFVVFFSVCCGSRGCTNMYLETSRSLLTIKVIGQWSRSHGLFSGYGTAATQTRLEYLVSLFFGQTVIFMNNQSNDNWLRNTAKNFKYWKRIFFYHRRHYKLPYFRLSLLSPKFTYFDLWCICCTNSQVHKNRRLTTIPFDILWLSCIVLHDLLPNKSITNRSSGVWALLYMESSRNTVDHPLIKRGAQQSQEHRAMFPRS